MVYWQGLADGVGRLGNPRRGFRAAGNWKAGGTSSRVREKNLAHATEPRHPAVGAVAVFFPCLCTDCGSRGTRRPTSPRSYSLGSQSSPWADRYGDRRSAGGGDCGSGKLVVECTGRRPETHYAVQRSTTQ